MPKYPMDVGYNKAALELMIGMSTPRFAHYKKRARLLRDRTPHFRQQVYAMPPHNIGEIHAHTKREHNQGGYRMSKSEDELYIIHIVSSTDGQWHTQFDAAYTRRVHTKFRSGTPDVSARLGVCIYTPTTLQFCGSRVEQHPRGIAGTQP